MDEIDGSCWYSPNLLDVANYPELSLCCVFLCIDFVILGKIGLNFKRIKQWQLAQNKKAHRLLCINSNLLGATILLFHFYLEKDRFLSHLTQVVLFGQNTLENGLLSKLKIYGQLMFAFISILNQTIIISCRTWLQLLLIKYHGKPEEARIAHLNSFCWGLLLLNLFVILIDMVLQRGEPIIAIYNSRFFHGMLVLVTFLVGGLFGYSSFLFKNHILSMNVTSVRMRKLMTIVLYAIFLSALVRCGWDLFNSFDDSVDILFDLKQYDKEEGVDNSLFGFFYLLLYTIMTNYFPLTLLSLLYCPEGTRVQNESLLLQNQILKSVSDSSTIGSSPLISNAV